MSVVQIPAYILLISWWLFAERMSWLHRKEVMLKYTVSKFVWICDGGFLLSLSGDGMSHLEVILPLAFGAATPISRSNESHHWAIVLTVLYFAPWILYKMIHASLRKNNRFNSIFARRNILNLVWSSLYGLYGVISMKSNCSWFVLFYSKLFRNDSTSHLFGMDGVMTKQKQQPLPNG